MFTGKYTLGEIVGANLKRLRKESGRTLISLGTRLYHDESVIRRWEKSCDNLQVLEEYAKEFGVTDITEFFRV